MSRFSATTSSVRNVSGGQCFRFAFPLFLIGLICAIPSNAEEKTGFAQVSGTVLFEGDQIPPRRFFKIDDDQSTCGALVPSEHLLIDKSTLGVKNAVVRLIPGEATGENPDKVPHETRALVNRGCHFEPHLVVLRKGETLLLKNEDPILHSDHFFSDKKSLDNTALTPHMPPVKKSFKEEGLYRVKCDIHEFMEAFILVDSNPWIAISDEKGRFDFGSLPAGNYIFSIWAESFDELTSPITLKAGDRRNLSLGVKPR
jgi:plastocyanin